MNALYSGLIKNRRVHGNFQIIFKWKFLALNYLYTFVLVIANNTYIFVIYHNFFFLWGGGVISDSFDALQSRGENDDDYDTIASVIITDINIDIYINIDIINNDININVRVSTENNNYNNIVILRMILSQMMMLVFK